MKNISILAFNVLIITLVYVGVMKIIDARYKEPITMSCYWEKRPYEFFGKKKVIIDFEENLYIEVMPCGKNPSGKWDCRLPEHISASELHEIDDWYGYNERYLVDGIYSDYIVKTHTQINRKTLRYRQSHPFYGLQEGKCSILDMPPTERDTIIQKARKDWNSKQPPKNNQI